MNLTLLTAVLKRNGYNLSQEGSTFIIESGSGSTSIVRTYLIFSIILILIGILGILYVSTFLGFAIMSIAIPLFMRINKLQQGNKSTAENCLTIDESGIEIRSTYEVVTIEAERIEEISYSIDKDSNSLSAATIVVATESEEAYELMQLFGEDKRYVEDDARIVANGIVKLLNET